MPIASTWNNQANKVLVIGGGAAGMLAAIGAADAGAQVTLLEKNEKLGKKIYITGKGRCNVTNACDQDDFLKHVTHNPRFLYSAFANLTPQDLMDRLESWGCPVMVTRGDRVFPTSEKASDVTHAFERQMRRLGVMVRLNTKVQTLLIDDERITGVQTSVGEVIKADQVILCTGGQSYPTTGSTGDGFAFLQDCGHQVLPPFATLIPLISNAPWVRALQGLSLKNVRLTLMQGKKKRFSDIGEMLFTHFGVSGPLVLSASSHMAGASLKEMTLSLDLKPGLTPEQLDARIMRDLDQSGKKQLRNILPALYPARLAEEMPALCEVDGNKLANAITKEERQRLVAGTKSLIIPISGMRPLAEAVVTRGGVSVKEVSPATLQSKKVQGLYIAGELLDVDALTGGFNLHIAFCTGLLAGQCAADESLT